MELEIRRFDRPDDVRTFDGDVFAVPPGHDSWVVGDEPYESIHLLGADHYATEEA
jgi:hypothetical protein